ncbi:MAG: hypothetical protein ACLQVJ_12375 [Syntrophobacteraceae bacterium]
MTNQEYENRLLAQAKRIDEVSVRLAGIREEFESTKDNDEATIISMLNRSMGTFSKQHDPDALSAEDELWLQSMVERSGPKRRKQ